MRAWRKFFTLVIVLVAAVFIAANWLLYYLNIPENGRPHRVEINRLALQIELNGFKNVDLSECEFVYNISEFGADFYDTAGDYLIREINGELYRFDYRKKNSPVNAQAAITVNVILAVMTAVVFGILLFVRGKIIRPFERLTNVPYELSKGNLTPPVKENKSRFFGKFLWGLDLLRENIEQQKQRELELQKEKKMLLLSLSHDIKTPLSAIKLYSKALSKDLYPDKEKQREIAESINEKADEIERYVTQIITASREDFLSLDLENGEFYLSELVQNIADYYIEKLKLVKTELVIGKYKNYLLFGDLNRAEEVLQNVIENALKYGNGKRVDLLFPDNDEGVLITVRNSGCKLNNYELPHIFESFWRGANSENIRGSGLGLYICRKLMHKMNGEIFAEINGEFISVTAVFSRA